MPNVDYLALGRGECFLSILAVNHPAIECRPLWPGRLCCRVPAGHRLAERKTVSPGELAHESLNRRRTEYPAWHMVRERFHEIAEGPRIAIVVRVAEAAIGLVAHGHGVAIVDEVTAMDAASDQVIVRPLEAGFRFQAYLSRSRDLPRSRYVSALEQDLLAVLAPRDCARPDRI